MKINFRVTLVNLFLISSLLSDTIIFNDGQQLKGKLKKITEKHPYDPNTGAEQEVLFKVEKYNLNTVPKNLVINKTADNVFMFDVKSIYKIEDDYGMLIYSSNKKLHTTSVRAREDTIDLEIFSTDLILSNNDELISIPLKSEISLQFSQHVYPLKYSLDVAAAIIGGAIYAGPAGAIAGPKSVRRAGGRFLEKIQYQGIGKDIASGKNYIITNKGAFETKNIELISYSIPGKVQSCFAIGGSSLVLGVIGASVVDAIDPFAEIGLVFVYMVIGAPIIGIMGEEASESRHTNNYNLKNINAFRFDGRVWQINLNSMLSNAK